MYIVIYNFHLDRISIPRKVHIVTYINNGQYEMPSCIIMKSKRKQFVIACNKNIIQNAIRLGCQQSKGTCILKFRHLRYYSLCIHSQFFSVMNKKFKINTK